MDEAQAAKRMYVDEVVVEQPSQTTSIRQLIAEEPRQGLGLASSSFCLSRLTKTWCRAPRESLVQTEFAHPEVDRRFHLAYRKGSSRCVFLVPESRRHNQATAAGSDRIAGGPSSISAFSGGMPRKRLSFAGLVQRLDRGS